ncbi:Hypothetical_protein [Hexamita inflata]|uniref:Hypothetical_protein n=1 Tax=Hexamita inflata TaxID=28002 RepID=A0AA86NBX9_9EUKA|nr:Hypothetical protein HINF_LOCUS4542 [Hexamita inflata]CAI9975711.1 Hypothetical protein HINF_LOCUS63356 [Hexamita inflata]
MQIHWRARMTVDESSHNNHFKQCPKAHATFRVSIVYSSSQLSTTLWIQPYGTLFTNTMYFVLPTFKSPRNSILIYFIFKAKRNAGMITNETCRYLAHAVFWEQPTQFKYQPTHLAVTSSTKPRLD